MVRMMLFALLVAAGCKEKQREPAPASQGSAPHGSAAMTGDASTSAPPAIDGAPSDGPAQTGDDLARRYEECVAAANEARWDDYGACYATTVMFEAPGLAQPRALDVELAAAKQLRNELAGYRVQPQLILVSGNTVIAIELHTATSAKTKKPVGFLLGHVIAADPAGKLTRDLAFWDAKTVEAQRTGKPGFRGVAAPFPTKIALVAKDDDTEKANLQTFTAMMEASENKDLVAFGDKLADDVVWSVMNRPEDLGKAEILAGIKTRLEKTDLHFKLDHAWAAGDYVASIETVSGTAPADAPDGKLKKGDKIERQLLAIHRFANGKLAQVWVFAQS